MRYQLHLLRRTTAFLADPLSPTSDILFIRQEFLARFRPYYRRKGESLSHVRRRSAWSMINQPAVASEGSWLFVAFWLQQCKVLGIALVLMQVSMQTVSRIPTVRYWPPQGSNSAPALIQGSWR
ncbi:hypothetical protein AB1N83_009209 [Pleurotus pulmonarius]